MRSHSLFPRHHEEMVFHLYGKMRIEDDAIGASGHGAFLQSDRLVTIRAGKQHSGRENLRANWFRRPADHTTHISGPYTECFTPQWLKYMDVLLEHFFQKKPTVKSLQLATKAQEGKTTQRCVSEGISCLGWMKPLMQMHLFWLRGAE